MGIMYVGCIIPRCFSENIISNTVIFIGLFNTLHTIAVLYTRVLCCGITQCVYSPGHL